MQPSPTIEIVDTKVGIHIVVALAEKIWREHYPSIIGEAQVDYMLKHFQSEEAIADQIHSGFEHFLIRKASQSAGYFAIKRDYKLEKDKLFLSKIYIEKSFRRQGLFKLAMKHITASAKAQHCHAIWLTVNKDNHLAVKSYEAMGFKRIREQVVDIGGGYVMDDYVYEMVIT